MLIRIRSPPPPSVPLREILILTDKGMIAKGTVVSNNEKN